MTADRAARTPSASPPRAICQVVTAANPGAIGIIQMRGDRTVLAEILATLTGVSAWPIGRLRLVRFDDIDEGLAGLVDAPSAQLMPHGGTRVIQRLLARLHDLGVPHEPDMHPRVVYPEARDDVEALMLATLARARSPLAVDLLLDQPRRWRATPTVTPNDRARSDRLDRLVDPPVVVLAGPPNVGKSTLSNTLFGRPISITLDRPGTTRDYTRGWIDLGGLVVQWHDTPGLRPTTDAIEQEAIEIAEGLLSAADLVVSITDAAHDWPSLPVEPDVRVAARSDLGERADADVSVCAPQGTGMDTLVALIRDRLVPPADLLHPGPWRFDHRLTAEPSPT